MSYELGYPSVTRWISRDRLCQAHLSPIVVDLQQTHSALGALYRKGRLQSVGRNAPLVDDQGRLDLVRTTRRRRRRRFLRCCHQVGKRHARREKAASRASQRRFGPPDEASPVCRGYRLINLTSARVDLLIPSRARVVGEQFGPTSRWCISSSSTRRRRNSYVVGEPAERMSARGTVRG